MTVWFTVKLDDRPGALARMATALAERGVNIAGIVGIGQERSGTHVDQSRSNGHVLCSQAAITVSPTSRIPAASSGV